MPHRPCQGTPGEPPEVRPPSPVIRQASASSPPGFLLSPRAKREASPASLRSLHKRGLQGSIEGGGELENKKEGKKDRVEFTPSLLLPHCKTPPTQTDNTIKAGRRAVNLRVARTWVIAVSAVHLLPLSRTEGLSLSSPGRTNQKGVGTLPCCRRFTVDNGPFGIRYLLRGLIVTPCNFEHNKSH